MKTKRCCAWLLAIIMLLTAPALPAGTLLSPVNAYAADQQSGDYVYTVLSNGTAKITEYKGRTTADLKIPSTLGGKKVTAIGTSAFFGKYELKSVTVPTGVTSIGRLAFGDCYNIKTVSLPRGLKTIGDNAFNNCSDLASPHIPSTVTSVGEGVFSATAFDTADNYTNKALYLDGWLLSGSSDDMSELKSYSITAGTKGIASYAFPGTETLTTVTLPASLHYIGTGAFKDCSSLSTIKLTSGNSYLAVQDNVLYNAAKTCVYLFPRGKKSTSYTAPSTLTTVAPWAFYSSETLQSVSLPNSVTKIGDYAFDFCGELTTAPLPSSLTSIGVCCFRYCTKLQNVTIPSGVTKIPESTFQTCSSLTEMPLHSNIKSIGNEAFSGCENLKSITIPDSVTVIGESAFKDCTNLSQVRLPATLKEIKEYTFDTCEALKSITLPETLTIIRFSAFGGSGLESIYIPDSVTEIEESAFQYSQLVTVRLPEGLTAIRAHSFDGLPLENVNIPSTVEVIETEAFGGAHFTTIDLPAGLKEIHPEAFSYCRQLTSIKIPDGVTRIEQDTFKECNYLTSVTLPKNLQRIEGWAFYDCRSLQSITMPDSVTYIGDNAFNTCVKLTSVEFSSNLNEIGRTAFFKCSALANITLPDSLEKIGNHAFSYTAIAETYCPTGLKQVGYNPFEYAPLSDSQPKEGVYWGGWIIGYEDFEESVETVNIKEGTRHIADHVFSPTDGTRHNYWMQYINLPDTIESIGEGALSYNNFTSLTIPGSVKTIGNFAISNCYNLESVTFEDGLVSMGELLFSGCGNLATVKLPSTLQHMGNNAFINTKLLDDQSSNPIKYADKWVIATTCYSGDFTVANGTVGICDHAFFNLRNGSVTVPKSVKYMGEQCMGYYEGDYYKAFEGFTLKCYSGSAAHTYAKAHGVNFTLICNHNYSTVTVKATTSKDGQTYKKCTLCGKITNKTTIYRASGIKLGKTAYTYNGKVQKPSVIVKDSKGNNLKSGTDYTVTYPSGMKYVGKYTIKVTLKGKYSGTKSLTYNINPKGTDISKVTAAKKGFKVTWKKQATQTSGYQVQYSTSSKFTSAKTVTVAKNSTTSKSVSGLTAKKKYYVRVRTYKTVTVGGKSVKLYSGWSAAKSVTTK